MQTFQEQREKYKQNLKRFTEEVDAKIEEGSQQNILFIEQVQLEYEATFNKFREQREQLKESLAPLNEENEKIKESLEEAQKQRQVLSKNMEILDSQTESMKRKLQREKQELQLANIEYDRQQHIHNEIVSENKKQQELFDKEYAEITEQFDKYKRYFDIELINLGGGTLQFKFGKSQKFIQFTYDSYNKIFLCNNCSEGVDPGVIRYYNKHHNINSFLEYFMSEYNIYC